MRAAALDTRALWVREGPGPALSKSWLLDRVCDSLRTRHYSRRTERAYVGWIRRFILFHGTRHPAEMGAVEVSRFLSALAGERKVSASTQNQALAALLFLYGQVLGVELPWLDDLVRATRPQRLPVVRSREEVRAVLQALHGTPRLMAVLLYGAGLRLLECARLRVKDLDFAAQQIVVRQGKGDRDRVTLLPGAVAPALRRHLERAEGQHAPDLRAGAGWVALPRPRARKYPNAGREWPWQWVLIQRRGSGDAITSTRQFSSAPFAVPFGRPGSRSRPRATPFGTRSPRHPDGPGAPGAPGRRDHDDLHARVEPWPRRGAVAAGRVGGAGTPPPATGRAGRRSVLPSEPSQANTAGRIVGGMRYVCGVVRMLRPRRCSGGP